MASMLAGWRRAAISMPPFFTAAFAEARAAQSHALVSKNRQAALESFRIARCSTLLSSRSVSTIAWISFRQTALDSKQQPSACEALRTERLAGENLCADSVDDVEALHAESKVRRRAENALPQDESLWNAEQSGTGPSAKPKLRKHTNGRYRVSGAVGCRRM